MDVNICLCRNYFIIVLRWLRHCVVITIFKSDWIIVGLERVGFSCFSKRAHIQKTRGNLDVHIRDNSRFYVCAAVLFKSGVTLFMTEL